VNVELGSSKCEDLTHSEWLDKTIKLRQQYPALSKLLPLLGACLEGLESVLTGQRSPLDVIFPYGNTDLVSSVYGESEVSLFYNWILAQGVLEKAQLHQKNNLTNRPIRILEIGAGTGASSEKIIQVMDQAGFDFEYYYTDIWDKLVDHARHQYSDSKFNMIFRVLDISIDPAIQGLTEHFDLIVATNVLHATPSLQRSLLNIKKLLLPHGWLILNESVKLQEYSIYTFGLLPGWWNAADRENRIDGSPLATEDTWKRLVSDIGFHNVHTLVAKESVFSAQMILAWIPTAAIDLRISPARQVVETLVDGLTPYG
jgi:SAM-dependent methyltransferase